MSSSVASLALNQSWLAIGFTNGAVEVLSRNNYELKFSNFDKTSKVLDATRGELFSRLQAPENLQGSGCRVQFGEESFLTRFFVWICKKRIFVYFQPGLCLAQQKTRLIDKVKTCI